MPPKKSAKSTEPKATDDVDAETAPTDVKKTTKKTVTSAKKTTKAKTTKTKASTKSKAATKKKSAEEEIVQDPETTETLESTNLEAVAENINPEDDNDAHDDEVHVNEAEVKGEQDIEIKEEEVKADKGLDNMEQTVQPEQTEQVGPLEQTAQPEQTEQVGLLEQTVQQEQTEQSEPMEQTEQPSTADEDKINAHRIFITRIAFEATKDDLEEYFNKFGTVHDAYCPRQHSNTNLNKGFGFISFDNEEAIQKVFDTAPHIIMGREVIVDRATGQKHHSSGVKRGNSGYGRHQRDHHNGMRFKRFNEGGHGDRPDKFFKKDRNDRGPGYTNDNRDVYNQSVPPYRQGTANNANFDPNKSVSYVFSGTAQYDNTNDTQSGRPVTSRVPRERAAPKLFIGRISFDTTVQSLRAYFSQFGEVVDAYIPRDAHTQRSKGFGFLTFANKNSIHAVLEPNIKHTLDGREIIVDYADVSNRRV